MKKSLKHHLERLILLPYYPIWLYQNKRIQRLRNVSKEAERWVAIADWRHGLADEQVENYKDLSEANDKIIKHLEGKVKLYEDLVKAHEKRGENFEKMVANYENIIAHLETRLRTHGIKP
jgi:hypothetical protein